jgi:hypothetical protein
MAGRNLEKTSGTIDRLEPAARAGEQGPRANALWDIGLLGNRGVQPDRAAEILLSAIHDDNENIRYWAVEGLAFLGTDAVVAPLLEIFRHDPSPMIRERAACGLAQSGMLNDRQRWTAVPRLLDYAGDYSLDPDTRKWVFQALRDITGKTRLRTRRPGGRGTAEDRRSDRLGARSSVLPTPIPTAGDAISAALAVSNPCSTSCPA